MPGFKLLEQRFNRLTLQSADITSQNIPGTQWDQRNKKERKPSL
jgi:hypothetical protein